MYQGQNAHKIMLIEETMSFGSVKSKIMEKLAVDPRCSELELKYLLDTKTEGCYPIQVDDESDWDAFKYCNSRGGDGTWPLPLYASVNEGGSQHGSRSMVGNMEQRSKSPGGDNRTLVVEEGGLVDMTVDGSNSHLLLNSDNGSDSTIDGKENTSSGKENHTAGKVIQTARAEPTTATEETRGKLLDVDRGK